MLDYKFDHPELSISISGKFDHVGQIVSYIEHYLEDLSNDDINLDSGLIEAAGDIVEKIHIGNISAAEAIWKLSTKTDLKELHSIIDEFKLKPWITGKTWTIKIANIL